MKYNQPQVKDYGTLLELTADIDVHFTGAVSNIVLAAMSAPTGGGVGGQDASGGGGGADGLGDAVATGGPPGKLPFTGFPVMLLAAAGAALTAFGAAIRSTVKRRP
jgi:hypothetical protein